jgi:ParB family transcriptional regulator, chromosome partitioning protein
LARRGLGKGLDVLIGSAASAEGQHIEELDVKDIRPNPRQPRRSFDEESLEQMSRSMESFGVVQPIIVRPVGTEYELVAGERRWRAARKAGLEKIPALVRQSSETDSLEVALIENIHRSDLNGIEEATAFQQLLEDFAITHEELSRKMGRSRTAITNTIRLLQLPARIQGEVVEGNLSTGHARALLALQEDPGLQDQLCARIVEEGLSVRETEVIAAAARSEAEPRKRERIPVPDEAEAMFSHLGEVLETRVKGSFGKKKGKLVIEFRNIGDLRRIYGSIAGEPAEVEPAEVEPDDTWGIG